MLSSSCSIRIFKEWSTCILIDFSPFKISDNLSSNKEGNTKLAKCGMWKWCYGHEKTAPIMLASFKSFTKRRTGLLIPVLLSHVNFFKLFCSYVLAFSLASTWESVTWIEVCAILFLSFSSLTPIWGIQMLWNS